MTSYPWTPMYTSSGGNDVSELGIGVDDSIRSLWAHTKTPDKDIMRKAGASLLFKTGF